MDRTTLARSLEELGPDLFGLDLPPSRSEAVGQALIDVLTEIKRLRSLDLSGEDPVVVFDPVKAGRS